MDNQIKNEHIDTLRDLAIMCLENETDEMNITWENILKDNKILKVIADINFKFEYLDGDYTDEKNI